MLRTGRACGTAFLDCAPSAIAVTVVTSLTRIVGLPLTPAYVHSIFEHLVALLGGRPAQAELSSWLAHASAAAADPSSSAPPVRQARRSGASAPKLLADMLSIDALPDEPETRQRTRVGQDAARRGGKSGRITAGRPSPEAALMPLAGFELPPLLRYSAVEDEIEFAQAQLRTVPPLHGLCAPTLHRGSASWAVESTQRVVSRRLSTSQAAPLRS